MDKNYIVIRTETEVLDISTVSEPNAYVRGATTITIREWLANPSIQYFTKSTATILLHCLPPSLQKLWAEFETGVISYIKEANAENL